MTLATAHTEPLDPYAAWQAASGAAYCERMRAIITHAACEENKCRSAETNGDLRCRFCGGLDNQTPPLKQEPPALVLVWDVDKTTKPEPESALDDSGVGDRIDGLAALDEIIDGLYEDPVPGDDFDDLELDLDDETLLRLFPELARDEDDDTSPGFQRFTEYQEAVPRYAVYHGRCKKCRGGYMDNVREWHDDNCFRCLACGWRTGLEYESNRAMHGVTP